MLPATTASRWVESIAKVPNATETLVRLAPKTGNVTRDVSAQTTGLVRKLIGNDSDLEALLNGEAQSDFDRVFGEGLPGGLVLENS